MILACDGLWDVLENQSAVQHAIKHLADKDSPEVLDLLEPCPAPLFPRTADNRTPRVRPPHHSLHALEL